MSASMPPASQVYEFGPFRLDCRERILSSRGEPIALTDKVFDLLLLLVAHRGHALSKAELMEKLWPDAVVEENNLTVNMSTLRKALGETASERRYIETLARRGYRFIAEVREAGAHERGADRGRLEPSRVEPRDRPPFVGREAELDRLTRLLRDAVAGRGRVVFVSGDPGMGKTELCERFLLRAGAEIPAALIASGRCLEQYGAGEPYLPFLEALRGWLTGAQSDVVTDVLRDNAPTWCSQFPSLQHAVPRSEAHGDGRTGQGARMLREMGDAITVLSTTMPVLLLLEDMHWADPSSSDLLQLIAQRAGSHRIMILVTLRAREVELENHPLKNIRRELLAHDQCEEIALPLLDRACISRYLDSRFAQHDLPPDVIDLVARTTEGQPLFATRFVQLLVERGDIAEAEGRWVLTRPMSELPLGVPDGVRGLIEKKLESLDEQLRRTLQYASVIAVEFTSAMLAALLAVDEVTLEEELDRLARRHRLIELLGEERTPAGRITLRYRFVHILYRQVLYEGLAKKRRMLIHAQVAERLGAEHDPAAPRGAAELALHFEAAGLFAQAIHHLQRAADNAGRWHANREARQHYARALGLVKELPRSEQIAQYIILHYNLGWAHLKVGDATAAIASFEAMLEDARSPSFVSPDPEGERARDAVFTFLAEPWRDAFGIYDMPRMPNQARSMGAVAVQCEAYWAICFFLLHTGRLDEMRSRVNEYLHLAEASRNEPRRVEALAWMTTRELALGNIEEATRILAEGMPAARAVGHLRALYLFLHVKQRVHCRLAEFEQAEAMSSESLALTYEAQGRLGFLTRRAQARMHLGRLSDALETVREAVDIAERADLEEELSALLNVAGSIYLEAGAFDRAIAHFSRAGAMCRERGLLVGEMHALIHLGRAHLEQGGTREADGLLRRAADIAREHDPSPGHNPAVQCTIPRGEHRLQLARCELLLARGDHALARASAKELRERAAREPGPQHFAEVCHLLARVEMALGDGDSAHRELQAALARIAARPLPLLVWKIAAMLGFERLAAGDRPAARDAFARAGDLIGAIRAGIRDDELRAVWLASPAVEKLREGMRAVRLEGALAV